MPAKELMRWIPAQKRWRKQYRQKTYYVSPRQLGCEPKREASRSAANHWWEARRKQIDEEIAGQPQHPQHVTEHYNRAIENHRRYAAWNRRFGRVEEAIKSEKAIELIRQQLKFPQPEYPLSKYYEDPLALERLNTPQRRLLAFDLQWQERYTHLLNLEREERQERVTEDSIEAHIEDYLKLERARHTARGKISAYYQRKQWLDCFRKWARLNVPKLEDLNEKAWEQFFIYLAGLVEEGTYTGTTASNYQAAARWFVIQRWEAKHLESLPRNISSRKYAFTKTSGEPVPFTRAEVTLYLDAATDWQKLFLLLMLNCGAYPSDIGQLRQDEVNWKKGRITRKRTKTRDRSKNVPLVDYPLWPETFRLLKKFRNVNPDSRYPELAVVNRNDNPLWREEEKTNKTGKKTLWRDDNIKSAYQQLQTRILKLKKGDPKRKPLKSLRKTGASILEQSEYGRFSEHFLGEAPNTVSRKHYAVQNGPEFDKAVMWLGREFGL
jgi:integrase